ncbi:hypothetical protein [Stackebrandtia nassauensis]|uniref:Uncharacterized protein n=1 Tax=Stackebrandtia nassauensis (strain DSM 44728 / CIP 108903 / NRRL B-16338 / NBRC 102104 / LLR-40K-21) TaxID=446470 RepID=D3Q386_STANL|nr:hypothetical protein [Stackebrandtia nassauensis]ADD40056.1 hypothetical protein Snas_0338 [Stackebrandtia nassauensis DSM 44728]
MGNAVLAGVALVMFGIFYWYKLWPKVQCWLLVAVGWGLGGMVGSGLQYALGQANDLSSTGMQLLFGVGVPGLFALATMTIFVLNMLPNKTVSTPPIGWVARICALLVPLTMVAMPSLGDNLMTSIGA